MCCGITARRVDQAGSELTINGQPVRAVALADSTTHDYYKRGGRRGGPAKARKHAQAVAPAQEAAAESDPGAVDPEAEE